MLRIDGAASGGDQGKLRDYMSFLWSPLEGVVSISTMCFLFISTGRLSFLVRKLHICSANLRKKLLSIKTVESKIAIIFLRLKCCTFC